MRSRAIHIDKSEMTKATQLASKATSATAAIHNITSHIRKRSCIRHADAIVPYVKRNIAKLRAYEDLPDQEVPAPSTCAPDKTPSYKLSVIVLRNGLIVTRRNYRLNVGDTQRQVYWDVLRAFPAGDERHAKHALKRLGVEKSTTTCHDHAPENDAADMTVNYVRAMNAAYAREERIGRALKKARVALDMIDARRDPQM